jgi:tetratricopeptide (TPR) repeat protein
MSTALLVEFFQQLPERRRRGAGASGGLGADGPEGGWSYPGGKARWRAAVDGFKKNVSERYLAGTLLRLLHNHDVRARRAAVFALGVLGTMEINAPVAARLHDEDADVQALAEEALRTLWAAADSQPNNDELYRLGRLRDQEKALAGLDGLLVKAPQFAEAYHRRSLCLFRLARYDRAAADGEKAVQLNPMHFAALAGLGQCYLHARRHRQALKAFRAALRIHPHLREVADAVKALESALGEEGRRDDKK